MPCNLFKCLPLAAGMIWSFLASITTAANLQLVIQHCDGGSPLIYDSLRYRNQAGEDWSVSRLSYLIRGLSLQREDGAWISPADSVAWMNATTHRQTLNQADLPPGKYQVIRFYIDIRVHKEVV